MILSHKCVQTSCKLPAETLLLWQHHHGDSNLTVFLRIKQAATLQVIFGTTKISHRWCSSPAQRIHQSPTYCVHGIDGSL